LTQNELRMVYNIERRHDLARDPNTPKGKSLGAAIASVRSRNPSFTPSFTVTFFSS